MPASPRGKYASKHPKDAGTNPQLTHEIQIHLEDGRLSCAAASQIAERCQVSMAEVGRCADLMEARIDRCILGLFGFEIEDGKKRRVTPAPFVPKNLESAIHSHLTSGRLTCKDAWEIATKHNQPRYAISQAAQALNIKISKCQLGAF